MASLPNFADLPYRAPQTPLPAPDAATWMTPEGLEVK